jgi:hypothetical protein
VSFIFALIRRPFHARPIASRAIAASWVLLSMLARPASAVDATDWANSAYEVALVIAVDDSARPQPGLEQSLASYLANRIDGTLRPLWNCDVTIAEGAARRQCFAPEEISWDDLPASERSKDKLIWLGVRITTNGFELSCREFDVHLRRWGPVRTRTVRQSSFLAPAGFDLVKSTFLPLVQISSIEGDNEHVALLFKGSALPRFSDQLLASSGAAFVPLRRRTDRSGQLVTDGIQPVPWTYLTLAEGDGDAWRGKIYSGVRRPFGATKRGLVEEVAIAASADPGETHVRFHARTDEKQGLAGYEVFRVKPDGGTERLGVTDRDGVATIPRTDDSVSMLMLRTDGQVLARVPIVNGMAELQQMPIADNVTRLQAQAEAQVVREELIDLVARRAIMMARVKNMLKNGRVEDARNLMAELDEMPSPSVFDRRIDNAMRRTPKSDDPSVQKRIDSLFASTREMLSKFLGTREVTELQNQVNAASTTVPAADEPAPVEQSPPPS